MSGAYAVFPGSPIGPSLLRLNQQHKGAFINLTRIALVPLVALSLALSSGPREDASILTPQGTRGEADPKTQAGPLAVEDVQVGDSMESPLPLAPPSARLPSPANTWNALDTGLNGNVSVIAVAGPDVYVGGRFTDAGGDPTADYFALWGSILRHIRIRLC